MLARLQVSILLPVTLVLASCANYQNVSSAPLMSPNTGNTFNTMRGKIYFGSETTVVKQSDTETARLLVILPDAVPFLGQEPIVLSTGQDGVVAIRTNYAAGRTPVSTPDLSSVALLSDFPQCPLSEHAVSAMVVPIEPHQALFSSLQLDPRPTSPLLR
jgi:hypothetical protein